jgi:hypothetical protein
VLPGLTIAGDGVTLVMRTVPVTVTASVTFFVASTVDVAVIVACPPPTPTMVPVRPSLDDTVATVALLLVNVTVFASVPRVSTVAATVKFSPTLIDRAPLFSVTPTTRGGLTVMLVLPLFERFTVDVAVMMAVPPVTPVTRPAELTVATLGVPELHSTPCDAPFWTSTVAVS